MNKFAVGRDGGVGHTAPFKAVAVVRRRAVRYVVLPTPPKRRYLIVSAYGA